MSAGGTRSAGPQRLKARAAARTGGTMLELVPQVYTE